MAQKEGKVNFNWMYTLGIIPLMRVRQLIHLFSLSIIIIF